MIDFVVDGWAQESQITATAVAVAVAVATIDYLQRSRRFSSRGYRRHGGLGRRDEILVSSGGRGAGDGVGFDLIPDEFELGN